MSEHLDPQRPQNQWEQELPPKNNLLKLIALGSIASIGVGLTALFKEET